MITDQRTLAGRYVLGDLLGEGGMAQVYRATDVSLGRTVAVKVLLPAFGRDRHFVTRFGREALAAARLNHPNVVSVFDTGTDGTHHFIVMELIEGRTLSETLARSGRMRPERAVPIAAEVAAALSAAHRAGIVHRDIKPGNVMIDRHGEVKVMDFGIARAITTDDSLTRATLVLGTACYLSPEQAQGYAVDGRADIYSLGCVLYEMVTGRPPFTADSPLAVAYKHVWEAPVPPSQLDSDIPSDLDAVVLTAMAKDPTDRYPTAQALRADLDRVRRGERVRVPRAGAGSRTAAARGRAPTGAPRPSAGSGTDPGRTRALRPVTGPEPPKRSILAQLLKMSLAAFVLGAVLLAGPLRERLVGDEPDGRPGPVPKASRPAPSAAPDPSGSDGAGTLQPLADPLADEPTPTASPRPTARQSASPTPSAEPSVTPSPDPEPDPDPSPSPSPRPSPSESPQPPGPPLPSISPPLP